MINIRLKISDVNNTAYKQIILRKFFNMVFFSADGKKLTIYTATVFGGMHENSGQTTGDGLISMYDEKAKCILRFQYEIENLRKTEKEKLLIEFKDLTKNFYKQTEHIEKVWGKCERLENQTDLNEKLKELYPKANSVEVGMPNDQVYYISEPEKGEAHRFITTCGEFKEENDSVSKYSYKIKSKMEPVNGIEYMNWVKSEISLPESIFYKRFMFEIVFSDSDRVTYFTPDFTWYFAPPEGYQVDKDTAELDIGMIKGNRNCVQSVADDTTVHFREWESTESIDECKKVRVDVKEYTSAFRQHKLSDQGKLAVKFTIENPNRGANKQFLIGLLLAFLLAFCADKTRMNDFYLCLKNGCSCGGKCDCQRYCNLFSLLFPVVVLLTYLSLIFRLKLCIPINRGKRYYAFYWFKIIGLIATLLLVLYAFGVWMVVDPERLRQIVKTCIDNWRIIAILTILSAMCNGVYLVYCIIFRKKKILDNL